MKWSALGHGFAQIEESECSAHALLFTTFARAAGIPAREAGGWYYYGDAYQAIRRPRME